ncbi:MAG: hypothetical protein HAW59_03110 [Betaproteobacteria bacterium]|nr:hypothetical protein [Betaproteobacteria bacterium]
MKNTTQNTTQQAAPQKAAELYKEAVQSATDYSSTITARQFAFARKLAEQHKDFSWEKLLNAPAEAPTAEYMTFARELAEDFAQASERSLDIWERTMVGAAENARAFLPPQAESYGEQWLNGVKTAGAAIKESVRATRNAAQLSAETENGRKTNGKK